MSRLPERSRVYQNHHFDSTRWDYFEPRDDDFNREHVARRLAGQPVVLIELFRRRQGLVVAPGNPRGIRSVEDLAGLRVAARQKDSGSHVLLEHLLSESRVARGGITMSDPPARSEADVAMAVADGGADAGLAIESAARTYRLDFVPLSQERYDLLVWRREYFQAPVQTLLRFCRGEAFAERAGALGGYDLTGLEQVHYNGG